ncbi:hypothetical protein, partial [Gilliamella sp. App2-1]|uniref:hypothetical protein n=1 Tax=Gilliamella sp. App2-1 TaxID=3120230 RepID=UPI001C3FFDF3
LFDELNDFLEFIFNQYILHQLLNLIPLCLLFFVVSSIVFYRMNIHIITLKNLGLLIIEIVLIHIVSFLLEQCQIVYQILFVNIIYLDSWFYLIIIISSLLSCGLYSLLIYYYIKIFSDWFDKEKYPFELTPKNSPKIHFILFLAFFFFLFITLSSFLLDMLLQQFQHDTSCWINVFLLLVSYVINFLMIVLLTKDFFKRTFVVLQSDRIIKSAIVTNILILTTGIIFLLVIYNIAYFISRINSLGLYVLILLPLAIWLWSSILSCMIVRCITKYYFAMPSKGQIGFN